MNKLPLEKQIQILNMLCEGSSMRSTSRIADVSINTVTKLLVDAGNACWKYQKENLKDLACQRVQCDEIWSYCYAKEKNVPANLKGVSGFGDVYTFTAIDADTKLMISWFVGKRVADDTFMFIYDLKKRIKGRFQLTTDGFKPYLDAVNQVFEKEIDYAMLKKIYENLVSKSPAGYVPSIFKATKKLRFIGNPKDKDISTSFVERQNLNMRMGMRRFTRLTNAFSKKIQNHEYAIALYFMFYNFVRIHTTLKISPAMAAGITDHLWSMEDIVELTRKK